MDKIGLIGGMSWESTIEYYRIMNSEAARVLGSLHSARVLMESYDFEEIAKIQKDGEWDAVSEIIADSAANLIKAGADFIVIAANTTHKIAPSVQEKIGDVPILHIADSTAKEILKHGYNKVALLGTKYTMQEDFYIEKLVSYGISVITPEFDAQDEIHRIIFEELCKGIFKDQSKETLETIISRCKRHGAQAVILGCTELPNIIKEGDLPVFNTTEIHALAAVEFALRKKAVEA